MQKLYRPDEQGILTVGEAGFSYARALASVSPGGRVKGVVATTLLKNKKEAESATQNEPYLTASAPPRPA